MRAPYRRFVQRALAVLVGLLSLNALAATFEVQLPASFKEGPQDGRLLLIFAPADQSPDREPRFLVNWDAAAIPFFGLDVEGWKPRHRPQHR